MRLHPSLLLLVVGFALAASGVAQVRVESGVVQGVRDHGVTVYKGIPYAAPPLGDLRWRAPQAARSWSGTRQAVAFGPACMQRIHGEFLPWTTEFLALAPTSEDCLYLNVWAPAEHKNVGLPVLVYIHGGAFSEGSGAVPVYDGAALARTGLVVVSINYRLGVFGFLAHPELTAESAQKASGNYGLLDQMAALRWVRRNIAGFGGDPGRVTIWGQSAGAFSVGALLASPEAAGLFTRAVADSGLSLAGMPMMNRAQAEEAGKQFAASRHAQTLAELRQLPAEALLPTASEMGMRFSPIVDGWVLPDTLRALSQRGADNDVAVITGFQANDGMLFSFGGIKTLEDFHAQAARQYGDLSAEFERLYPAVDLAQARAALTQAGRDRDRVSQYLWAMQRVANHRQPVYTYFFDRAIPWPQHPEFGAFHSGELPYFFLNLGALDRPWEETDRKLAARCAAYLRHFAAIGDPNSMDLPLWDKPSEQKPTTLRLGAETHNDPVASPEKLDFWTRYLSSPAGANAPPF